MLSPAAIGVLEKLKVRLLEDRRAQGGLCALSVDEIREVYQEQGKRDAKEYANWVGAQLAEMVKAGHDNAEQVLMQADLWYKKQLRTGYLVQPEWIEHAYQVALRLSRAR